MDVYIYKVFKFVGPCWAPCLLPMVIQGFGINSEVWDQGPVWIMFSAQGGFLRVVAGFKGSN